MRILRAAWLDKSLLLLLVPVLVVGAAFAVQRVSAEPTSDETADAAATTTTAPTVPVASAPPASPDGGAGAADGSAESGSGGFTTGGITSVDDEGNFVRLPNNIPNGVGVAGVDPNQGAGSGAAAAPVPTTAPTTPSATPTTPSTTPTTQPASVPSTPTPTTIPVEEPPPALDESPLTALLPVSAVLIAGGGWLYLSWRRRRSAA